MVHYFKIRGLSLGGIWVSGRGLGGPKGSSRRGWRMQYRLVSSALHIGVGGEERRGEGAAFLGPALPPADGQACLSVRVSG